jgi:hypothetical protein
MRDSIQDDGIAGKIHRAGFLSRSPELQAYVEPFAGIQELVIQGRKMALQLLSRVQSMETRMIRRG